MRVVVEGDDSSCLSRAGHHHSHVLANFFQVVDDVFVACVESNTHTRQVRALRERVQCNHTVRAVLQDALAGLGPGEFHVALVAEDGHTVRATPRSCSRKVVKGTGWIARRVNPQHERLGCVGRGDGREVEAATRVHRHSNRATAGENRPHLVGGIRHRGIQHHVAVGAAQLHVLRGRGNELFRANACCDLTNRDIDGESPTHPLAGSSTQRL